MLNRIIYIERKRAPLYTSKVTFDVAHLKIVKARFQVFPLILRPVVRFKGVLFFPVRSGGNSLSAEHKKQFSGHPT